MCGRYAISRSWDEVRVTFELDQVVPPSNWRAESNVRPTQVMPFIRLDEERTDRVASIGRWGLVPHWVKTVADWKASTFNARAETVMTKPTFAPSFRTGRRCLVPADGWYEWPVIDGRKQPVFITTPERRVTFAGLWSSWLEGGVDRRESFTIVVTGAAATISELHDRMPVILRPEEYAAWLGDQPDDAYGLLRAYGGKLNWCWSDPVRKSAAERAGRDG